MRLGPKPSQVTASISYLPPLALACVAESGHRDLQMQAGREGGEAETRVLRPAKVTTEPSRGFFVTETSARSSP